MTKVEDYREAVKAIRPDIERAGHGDDWMILRRDPDRPVWWLDWHFGGGVLDFAWMGYDSETAAEEAALLEETGVPVFDLRGDAA